MNKIAVIGAGITGATTAHMLLEKGYDVTVFDRHHYAAMGTSFANGGQLSASNAEVWNSWSTVIKGMKFLLRKDAPLSVNLMPNWHKYSWLTEFLWAIKDYERNTIDTVKLAIEARRYLNAIAAHYKIDFDHQKRGILHFYRNSESFRSAKRVNKIMVDAGLQRREVSPHEITEIEPALEGGGEFSGGFFTPFDSSGDIHKFSCGVIEGIQARGACVNFGYDICSLRSCDDGICVGWKDCKNNGKRAEAIFSKIVICAGVDSRKFASMLGDRVNIYPMKGYSITVEVPSGCAKTDVPWVSLLDEDAKIVTSRLGADRYRVAGTAEINGYNLDIRADRIQPLINWVRYNHPRLPTSKCVHWAGLRPMMPNMMPVIRRGRKKGVYFNTGHGHLGWTLSAVTAEMVSNLISDDFAKNTRYIH